MTALDVYAGAHLHPGTPVSAYTAPTDPAWMVVRLGGAGSDITVFMPPEVAAELVNAITCALDARADENTCTCAAEVLGNNWHTPGCTLAPPA